ncbi:MAG: hypothetical protein ABIQ44_11875 [Chloroflexia bacterium]
MARAYQPKKTSAKLMEGISAGLIGGVAFIIVTMLADLILRSGDLFYTMSRLGSIFTGSTATPQVGSTSVGLPFIVGALLILVIFALGGIGFVSYLPIVFKLGLPKPVFGAIYGLFIWLSVFLTLLGLVNRDVSNSINLWAILVSCVLAGAATGLGLGMVMSKKGGDTYGQAG